MSETSGIVSGRKDGDKVSNGRHILRGLYKAKQEKQLAEVGERAQARAMGTPEEQLALLDQRLGAGVGAKKERAILSYLVLYIKGMPSDEAAKNQWVKDLKDLIQKIYDAKMESLGFRIMRQLGLSDRPITEYRIGCIHAGAQAA